MKRLAYSLATGGAIFLASSIASGASGPSQIEPVKALADAAAKATTGGHASALQLAMLLGAASMLPAVVLVCTCFTRFTIVFSFLKTGLGTAGAPPNQVLVGLALFMTMFVMAPVATAINKDAVAPYLAGQIDEAAAFEAATPTLRAFLLRHTRQNDLAVFYEASGTNRPRTADDVPLRIAVPAFALSEIRTAFQMGLVVLLPFLVIDLIVATVLSALGMVMLPPSVVSLPVKLLVFITVDGWHLVVQSLLRGMS